MLIFRSFLSFPIKGSTVGSKKGFTLIEVIVTLMLVGIISVFATFGVVQVTNGYVQSVSNAVSSVKGSLVLSRLYREISNLDAVEVAGNDSILFTREGAKIGLALVGTTLLMQEDSIPSDTTSPILVDNVHSFSLAYIAMDGNPWTTASDIDQLSRIDLSIVLNNLSSTITFQTSINPIYNNTFNGP